MIFTLPDFSSNNRYGLEWYGKVGVNTEGRFWQQGLNLTVLIDP